MGDNKIQSQYAPAERSSEEEITKAYNFFSENKTVTEIVNSVSQMLVILNENRQIIFANNLFTETFGFHGEKIIGKRPGEAVNCLHSTQSKGGCGTTEFCKTCGAVNSILEAQKGEKSTKECRIITTNNDALDLRVTATPYEISKDKYTVFAINDISNEKRRQTLERVFFHDVLNSAGGISGLSELISEAASVDEMSEFAKIIHRTADNLVSEIQMQKQLISAERGDLELNFATVNTRDLLADIALLYATHEITGDKIISIHEDSEQFKIETDPVILRRIIGNMTKNAIEASMPNGIITLNVINVNGKARFSVHNTNVIERETQLQIFKRSFSTKGMGRGIGTYSMKLLGEKYLGGKVWFESNEEIGTLFYIEI